MFKGMSVTDVCERDEALKDRPLDARGIPRVPKGPQFVRELERRDLLGNDIHESARSCTSVPRRYTDPIWGTGSI